MNTLCSVVVVSNDKTEEEYFLRREENKRTTPHKKFLFELFFPCEAALSSAIEYFPADIITTARVTRVEKQNKIFWNPLKTQFGSLLSDGDTKEKSKEKNFVRNKTRRVVWDSTAKTQVTRSIRKGT